MDDKLRRYIEGLFKDVPPTKSMVELKEEMLQNTIEKYQDLLKEGRTEDAAYNIAVAGIGDINSLIKDMEKSEKLENGRQKTAMFTSIAVMIYILSVIPIFLMLQSIMTFTGGIIGFLLLVSVATGILVYNNMSRVNYYRNDDTMVEEFKEWKIKKSSRRGTRISISFALWSILFALYFLISFGTNAWHITWLVFIFGIAIEAFINIIFIMKK